MSNIFNDREASFWAIFNLQNTWFLLITLSSKSTDKDTSAHFNGRAADQHLPTQCECELSALLEDKFINGVAKFGFKV